jgi:hypothetical protein
MSYLDLEIFSQPLRINFAKGLEFSLEIPRWSYPEDIEGLGITRLIQTFPLVCPEFTSQ